MAGAQQPLAAVVKHLIGLPVQLHRHMRAAVQVSLRRALKADGESAAGLARIDHVKRHGQAAL